MKYKSNCIFSLFSFSHLTRICLLVALISLCDPVCFITLKVRLLFPQTLLYVFQRYRNVTRKLCGEEVGKEAIWSARAPVKNIFYFVFTNHWLQVGMLPTEEAGFSWATPQHGASWALSPAATQLCQLPHHSLEGASEQPWHSKSAQDCRSKTRSLDVSLDTGVPENWGCQRWLSSLKITDISLFKWQ